MVKVVKTGPCDLFDFIQRSLVHQVKEILKSGHKFLSVLANILFWFSVVQYP